jgi:tetratricopeptide (TPR) repeat protein
LVALIVWVVVIPSQGISQKKDLKAAHKSIEAGHVAFAGGSYDEATAHYGEAIRLGSTWDWLPELITTAKHRKELGEIKPVAVHKACLIYVTELYEDGKKSTNKGVTENEKKKWRMYAELMNKIVESFSEGQWSMTFDEKDAVSSYKSDTDLNPANPDHLNLEEFFFENANTYDGYMTIAHTISPARGLARQYPHVHGVLYGPHRGMLAVNAGTHGFDVLFHEFFHTVEWVSGGIGGPAHGFRDEFRHHFPEWKGSNEFDYYRWHFQTTLPPMGWKKLNHTTRWRMPDQRPKEILAGIKKIYATISLADRREADSLAKQAFNLKKKDPDASIGLYKKVLKLSPCNEDALAAIIQYYRKDGDTAQAEKYIPSLRADRLISGFYPVTDEIQSYGEVNGQWYPEDISESGSTIKWDVIFDKAGPQDVTLFYTEGWNAIDIEWVALYGDDKELSRDAHKGLSGKNKENITYRIDAPAGNYTLKAFVKGKGGFDSNGLVLLRKAE